MSGPGSCALGLRRLDLPGGRGRLDPASTICCVITETGLKSEARVESRAGETLTCDRLVALARERLAVP